MSQRICYVIVILLLVGCEDNYYEPIQPHSSAHLRGRASMVPQWPMFHHDARHTGNVNSPLFDVAGPQRDTIAVAWRILLDNNVYNSPAIGNDGTIYCGTYSTFHNTDSCSFYAINPNGTVWWRYFPIGSVLCAPAIGDDGSVYFGANGAFYALTSSGQLKWKNVEPGINQSSPAIGRDGTVYYVTLYVGQEYLKAVDPSSGSLKWQVKGGDNGCSPAIGEDGTIYYSNHGTIRAVNIDGKIKWSWTDSSYSALSVWSIEIGYDTTIYFVAGLAESPYLWAIDNHGQLRWKKDVHEWGTDPCIDMLGNIYLISASSGLVCMTPNGQIQWQTPVAFLGQLNVPLVLDKNGITYSATSDDVAHIALEAFDKTSSIWQFGSSASDRGGAIVGAPTVFGGSLFFSWIDGPPYLYCLH